MDVSVEITTFNRKDVLARVLEHLQQQSYPLDCFEVVISDDGSTDGLLDVVASIKKNSPLRLRLLKSEHRGPGFAHNRGIEGCSADLVIMLAADVLPVPNLIEEHLKSHQQHPEPEVVVAGRLLQSDELPGTPFQRRWNRAVNAVFAGDTSHVRHGNFLVNNISFKRAFMLAKGMFKEWPPAAQEDVELGYRLAHSGMRLISNQQALAFHYHIETLQSVAVRSYVQGYNWHYLEAHVSEPWVRSRGGSVRLADGLGFFVRTTVKETLRRLLVNRASVPTVMVPLINWTETRPWLAPLSNPLIGKVTTYYFHLGLSDYRRGRPSRPPSL